MKRFRFLALLLAVLLAALLPCGCSKGSSLVENPTGEIVDTSDCSIGLAACYWDGAYIQQMLTYEQEQTIIELFDGKPLYKNLVSPLSFSALITVSFFSNEGGFYINAEGEPVVYDFDTECYFPLSDAENEQLMSLLRDCGIVLPMA